MRERSTSVRPGLLSVAIVTIVFSAFGLPAEAAAQPVPASPEVIDGPSPDILSLGGISIARDGTGGLVYLKNVGGVAHVFVARLIGSFQGAQQIDGTLPGASSQPVIAAGNDGVVLVAFVNGGQLYVSEAPSPTAGWQPPQAQASGAANPAIAMSNFGKAYLAFTAARPGGGQDVRVEYFSGGTWTAAGGALNVAPGDDGGTGAGRPAVAAAGDGVGIVAWGEAGHIYARRVWGASPSVASERLDPSSFAGSGETGAGSPAISVGGDSSYVDVAFQEGLSSGGQAQTRVLVTRLIAEDVAAPVAVDGLGTSGSGSGSGNAAQPGIAMNEYGRGFATAATNPGGQLVATVLGTNGAPGSTLTIDPAAGPVAPFAVPALAGLTSTLIAWQQTPAPGSSDIAMRYATGGVALGATEVVSSPAQGPTQAQDGLAAAGDNEGDAAAAWVQGAPGLLSIDTAQMFVAPGQASPSAKLAYTPVANPVLSWTAAREEWGPLTYTVTLDGNPAGQTTGTSLTVPAGLIDGPHVWQVTATNPAGLRSTSAPATVFVDTTPPRLRAVLSGRTRARRRLTLRLGYADAPNPAQPGARASGIAAVTVRWGDRTPLQSAPALTRTVHVYAKAGLYRLTVTVTDRAGNATTISRYVRILP